MAYVKASISGSSLLVCPTEDDRPAAGNVAGDLAVTADTHVLWIATSATEWAVVGPSEAGAAAWGAITGTLANQTDLQTALNSKQAAGTYATGTGTASGTNTGDQTTVSGNAGTATALQTPRTINGVSFDGTANIVLPAGGEAFPVGSVFISVVDTNPGTLLGYGTWSAFAAGRVLVGLDAGDPDFDTVEETGGAKTHTLTTAEMPAHVHGEQAPTSASSGAMKFGIDTNASGTQAAGLDTASAGGGGAHNNLQPYVVVYMWKRTS